MFSFYLQGQSTGSLATKESGEYISCRCQNLRAAASYRKPCSRNIKVPDFVPIKKCIFYSKKYTNLQKLKKITSFSFSHKINGI